MKVWSIIAWGKVIAYFENDKDAEQVCLLLQSLVKLPCTVVPDTISVGPDCKDRKVFKTEASSSLIQFLDLVEGANQS